MATVSTCFCSLPAGEGCGQFSSTWREKDICAISWRTGCGSTSARWGELLAGVVERWRASMAICPRSPAEAWAHHTGNPHPYHFSNYDVPDYTPLQLQLCKVCARFSVSKVCVTMQCLSAGHRNRQALASTTPYPLILRKTLSF